MGMNEWSSLSAAWREFYSKEKEKKMSYQIPHDHITQITDLILKSIPEIKGVDFEGELVQLCPDYTESVNRIQREFRLYASFKVSKIEPNDMLKEIGGKIHEIMSYGQVKLELQTNKESYDEQNDRSE
jgi:hypothetical protein